MLEHWWKAMIFKSGFWNPNVKRVLVFLFLQQERAALTGHLTSKVEEIKAQGIAVFCDDQGRILQDVAELQKRRAKRHRVHTIKTDPGTPTDSLKPLGRFADQTNIEDVSLPSFLRDSTTCLGRSAWWHWDCRGLHWKGFGLQLAHSAVVKQMFWFIPNKCNFVWAYHISLGPKFHSPMGRRTYNWLRLVAGKWSPTGVVSGATQGWTPQLSFDFWANEKRHRAVRRPSRFPNHVTVFVIIWDGSLQPPTGWLTVWSYHMWQWKNCQFRDKQLGPSGSKIPKIERWTWKWHVWLLKLSRLLCLFFLYTTIVIAACGFIHFCWCWCCDFSFLVDDPTSDPKVAGPRLPLGSAKARRPCATCRFPAAWKATGESASGWW